MQSCSSKQIYESLNSSPRFTHNQHSKQKCANILKTETDWSKVWKTVHGNKTGNKIKPDIFCQLHLNFFTRLMAFKNQLQTSAICNLCRKHQAEQHHEILSCNVTKNLFDRFQILLMSIFPDNIYEKEMVLDLKCVRKKKSIERN